MICGVGGEGVVLVGVGEAMDSGSDTITTKKMPISDQEFLTDPKSPLKKSYL